MRLTLLHTRLSGYLAACLREFKAGTGAELLIYCWPNQPDAPFDAGMFADLGEIRNRREHTDAEIEAAVRAFQPDAILTSGWADKGYVKICKQMRKHGVPVIAGCDTQWKGSLRQHVASWVAPWHLHKAIKILWVTGERQATLARALGYDGACLWDGYYACDWERFALPLTSAPCSLTPAPSFLYVGRYVPEKGIEALAEAYQMYQQQVEKPWPLVCAGAGPLKDMLVGVGADDRGFVQPGDLPDLMRSASAFVLPSRFEPWGVVVQEAAASGLPLILSDACGAGVHLLRDQFNGFQFPAKDSVALAERMVKMSAMGDDERRMWAQNSFALSRQYTPERWATTLATGLKRYRTVTGRPE